MFSTRLYIQILLRVVGILLLAGAGVVGLATGKALILGSMALLIALWLTGRLVAFLNASNRRMQLFLDMIEDNESMSHFPENIGSREQQRLHAAFNRIHKLITENKRKEFDRELYRKEAESWDKLMHVLTHEIMNSIAPIVSLSGTLLSYFHTKGTTRSSAELTDVVIGKTIRGLQIVKSQGQSLMNFTESYRRLSYLKPPALKPFPLNRLIGNLQGLLQPDLARQHVQLSVAYPADGHITLEADEELLSQVMLNLVKNAMQALEETKEGCVRIQIGCEANETRIEVSDNGPGIARELMEDIFVPFFTTKPQGSGIGLSLSRQIVRMHGGQLLVSSVPYIQTCFTILLPSPLRNNDTA